MAQDLKTILLIDDEASQRESMSEVLRDAGYRVLAGSDYAEGIDIHRQHGECVDLLLVDVSLPDGNGFELAKALQGAELRPKVLFVSGTAGAELCRFYGMSQSDMHLLHKPVRPEELAQRVKRLLLSDD